MSYKAKVKFEVDLDNLIRKTFADQRLRDKAREVFSDYNARQELGFKFIDEIVKRTREDNIDKNSRSFKKPYSSAYKKSAAFKIYGKTNAVDLTLTGEMLSNITTKSSRDAIIISFISEEQAAKAHGHINGTRSKKGNRQLPVRDFFGLPLDVRSKLLKKTMREFNEQRIAEFE